LTALYSLKLIPEAVFADTAVYFDGLAKERYGYNWEHLPLEWFTV
jgi:hypothetical protein